MALPIGVGRHRRHFTLVDLSFGEARHDAAGKRGIGQARHRADLVLAKARIADLKVQTAVTGKSAEKRPTKIPLVLWTQANLVLNSVPAKHM